MFASFNSMYEVLNMGFRGWDKVVVSTKSGPAEGIAPLIISASRATDIPAFHADWLINRLREGYVKWVNPFNQKPQYVSWEKVRVIVFWTKNARPLLKHLPAIQQRGINYYFLFTVNDYETEGLEPGVPPLRERVNTFIELSEKIGKEKVIWRFDPILLTDKIDADSILDRIYRVGSRLYKHTEKLVFSFADIDNYAKVAHNLAINKIRYKNADETTINYIAANIGRMAGEWNIVAATCAEKTDLSAYGIHRNKCIDDRLMLRLFRDDEILMRFLGYQEEQQALFAPESKTKAGRLKDPGQRQECGCIVSKDIGQYNTCLHLCKYCYANTSGEIVRKNFAKMRNNPNREAIIT